MQSSRPRSIRRGARRLAVGSLATVAVIGLLSAAAMPAGATPRPPTPPAPVAAVTKGDVAAAQSAKNQVAAQVGQLSADLAQMRNQIEILKGKAELAEQKYALAISRLEAAHRAQRLAAATLRRSALDVQRARARFINSIRSTYMAGDVGGASGALLTANDPSALLEETTLEQYLTSHKADAVGEYQAATVAHSNDEAAARRTVVASRKAEQAAKDAKEAAFAAVAQAKEQERALQGEIAQKQRDLNEKKAELYATQSNRAKYLNYLNALDSYHQRKAEYDAWKRRMEEERRAREARRHNGGGGGGGGGGWSSGPSAPSGGSWTADAGRRAVARAMSQLGVPYAWAGGGVGGPSWGVCDGSNGAPNDCNVRGFDCSGLVLYAWGRYWAHYAATQYYQAGSFHPSLGNLRPGDLLFWSYNGTVSGIHHVAIYKGNGEIIQAPESGSYVMVSSMYAPGAIFGATRPLT